MDWRIAYLVVFLSIPAMAGGILQQNPCKKKSPNPNQVEYFYEDNPTYQAPITNPWPTGTPESQGLKSSVLSSGSKYLTSLPQPLSFLVLRNNTLVWENYFNGSSASDSNNVHSASKSILGLLYGIALEEGYIQSIDQKVSEILPSSFTVPKDKQDLTVRHLLTMSAGYQWVEDKTEYDIEKKSDWVQQILNLPMKNLPGEKFNYSTGNTHLLSAILTEASGMSTCDFARSHLFDNMGITFEHWGRDPQGYFSGGYNLYLKPTELLKLGQLYLQNGEWNGKSLVPKEWVSGAETAEKVVDSVRSYGHLLWLYRLNGHSTYKFWGYGGQFVYVIPDYNLVVVTTADTKQEYTELKGEDFLNQYIFPAIQN